MPSFIHESAIVSPKAKIGTDCRIGAFSTIGDDVVLGDRVHLESHVVIDGTTFIGEETRIFPFVSIGLAPQDLKYKGEPTVTEVGNRNQIREFVTIHRGTEGGGGLTKVGDDNLLMAQAHIAHDCVVGNEVIMANGVALAGHATVADKAYIGGYTGIHQFCSIGRESFIGGYSMVSKDVMPYSMNQGNHAKCFGLNSVGLKRRGYSRETLKKLRSAFHFLLSAKLNTTQAIEKIREEITDCEEINILIEFIETSSRGVVK
jgi:UDP-N-acetylglucosamine acyltransferase